MRHLPSTIFCSDFHLKNAPEECPAITNFFKNVEGKAQAVVILGDLFDCWWGDDHSNVTYASWENFFASLSIECYFLAGNRDFLIGQDFFERTHIIPLYSGEIVCIGDKKIALFHGDEPGLREQWYQLWRAFSRHNFIKNFYLKLPETFREKIALKLRRSREGQSQSYIFKELEIDITKWLSICSEKPNIIINGHLHFPLSEKYGDGLQRYQLGCWDDGQHSFILASADGTIEHFHSNQLIIR